MNNSSFFPDVQLLLKYSKFIELWLLFLIGFFFSSDGRLVQVDRVERVQLQVWDRLSKKGAILQRAEAQIRRSFLSGTRVPKEQMHHVVQRWALIRCLCYFLLLDQDIAGWFLSSHTESESSKLDLERPIWGLVLKNWAIRMHFYFNTMHFKLSFLEQKPEHGSLYFVCESGLVGKLGNALCKQPI